MKKMKPLLSGQFQVPHETCKKVMGSCTAQCNMLLFCVKTVMRETCEDENKLS